jgi:squalene-hopene/tetraprenyl-beta-curcumene cyclase
MRKFGKSRRVVGGLTLAAAFLALGLASCQRPLSDAAPEAKPGDNKGGAKENPAAGPDLKQWQEVTDKAVGFLRKSQDTDGSFSKQLSLGITGVATTGLLQSGRVDPDDPVARNALKFIESLINEKDGHLAGENPRNQLKNYVTSVNVLALSEVDRILRSAGKEPRYKKVVDRAGHYLKQLQWDDSEGIDRKDPRWGGVGYDSKDRPDLSNSQFAIDALKDLLPKDDPLFKEASVFVSRCQNFKSEHNDLPTAGLINDGSLRYAPTETKADPLANGGLPGYGSMTYAGVKSLIYAGVDRNDPRVKAAREWIRKNYTVEHNPGMPQARSQQALYYYYHMMAKCLDALGDDFVEDDKGVKHDWRKDITEALAKRQKPDGSWINEADRWMEGDPNLVTGYCLMTLSYCKPKK